MNLRVNKGEKMSFYSNLKEIYKDTTQMIQGKDSAGKIVYLLKTLSFVAVCLQCRYGDWGATGNM